MQIDIRDAAKDKITEIRFSDSDIITINDTSAAGWIEFHDSDGNEYSVHTAEIDNLILALQKVKELRT